MRPLAPSNPKDRFEVYRFFNGLSAEAKEGIDRRHTRVPLVKTFLLEHVACRGNGHPKPPSDIFAGLGAEIRKIDDRFMGLNLEVFDPDTKKRLRTIAGFLEQYDERFFAYYTCEDSKNAIPRVRRWIQEPDLDFAWFSSPLLQELWNQDVSKRGHERIGKLVFQHHSIFEMPENFASPDEPSEDINSEDTAEEVVDDEESNYEEGNYEDKQEIGKRNARFEMRDRIGKINSALLTLQDNYGPLNAIHALRLPSRQWHGGHDLYQDGRITNRTDSFEDHRNTVRYLYRIYKAILEATENSAWQDISQEQAFSIGRKGVPLIVRFEEHLSEATFNRWVQLAFRKGNAFKLWGDPIRLGPTKVHVYGADRHLWQPINLELTEKGVVAILPQRTCGNTFHRLVANIQHYVCPKIQAWVGSESFQSIVSQWPNNAEEANED